MISGGGEDKGLVEARDDGGFECAFSDTLVMFRKSMSNNKARRYQDNQIKYIFDLFRRGEVYKMLDQNRRLILYGENLKCLTNRAYLFSDPLRGILLCARWLVQELEKVEIFS